MPRSPSISGRNLKRAPTALACGYLSALTPLRMLRARSVWVALWNGGRRLSSLTLSTPSQAPRVEARKHAAVLAGSRVLCSAYKDYIQGEDRELAAVLADIDSTGR
jgi:hypothetical protein